MSRQRTIVPEVTYKVSIIPIWIYIIRVSLIVTFYMTSDDDDFDNNFPMRLLYVISNTVTMVSRMMICPGRKLDLNNVMSVSKFLEKKR